MPNTSMVAATSLYFVAVLQYDMAYRQGTTNVCDQLVT